MRSVEEVNSMKIIKKIVKWVFVGTAFVGLVTHILPLELMPMVAGWPQQTIGIIGLVTGGLTLLMKK